MGNTVKKLPADGPVTVTFSITADTPAAGTPPEPVTCRSSTAPLPRGTPLIRVSRMRLGVTGWYDAPAPDMGVSRSAGWGLRAKIWVVMSTRWRGTPAPVQDTPWGASQCPMPTWVQAGFRMLAACGGSAISFPWMFDAIASNWAGFTPLAQATFSPGEPEETIPAADDHVGRALVAAVLDAVAEVVALTHIPAPAMHGAGATEKCPSVATCWSVVEGRRSFRGGL